MSLYRLFLRSLTRSTPTLPHHPTLRTFAFSTSAVVGPRLIGANNASIVARQSASQSTYLHGIQFSTSVPNDPDTHDDFKPKNKLENADISVKDIVQQDVKDNPVMLYMKGDPEIPRCGFSSLAVRVLQEYRIPIASRNILEDPELKLAVRDFSHWPTFPQIFIKGEFIGGSDIILNMHQNGELKEKLKDIVAQSESK